MIHSFSNFKTLLFISFLALSLPLATNLVLRSSDDRSSATETDKSKISLKIAFKGLKPESKCSTSLKTVDLDIVNVTAKAFQSDIGTSMTPIAGEVNQNGDQVFLISNIALDNNFKSVDSFNYFQIKNSSYLSARMCFNNQSSKMTTSTACDITLTNGTTYDFSNYSLLPGDLNQDGIVNSSDFSMVKQNVDPSADSVCDQEGDLNYDGIVNSFDTSYLKQSLLQTNDEVVIDLTTITPTPTAEPTPTMSPQVRSLTAQKIENMNYWFYTPNGYTKDKKWPLVIYYHGDGGWGNNELNKILTAGDLAGHLKRGSNYDTIAIEPQFNWPGNSEMVLIKNKLIPYLIENYNVDIDRISLMGSSSGAGRTIHMALKYPGFFSCLVTMALCENSSSWGKTLAKENLWAFHGSEDTVCSKRNSELTVNRVSAAGGSTKLTILKGVGHGTSTKVLYEYRIVNWMIRQVRGQPRQN